MRSNKAQSTNPDYNSAIGGWSIRRHGPDPMEPQATRKRDTDIGLRVNFHTGVSDMSKEMKTKKEAKKKPALNMKEKKAAKKAKKEAKR